MSLKKICCVAVADRLPDEILAQPDYRELLHRSLPVRSQTELFRESREYYPDGHLKRKTFGDMRDDGGLDLHYEPEGQLGRCRVVDLNKDMILDISFNANGTIRKCIFCNPTGYGFQLSCKGPWGGLTITYQGKSHGVSMYHTRTVSFCTMYENGACLGSILDDRELD